MFTSYVMLDSTTHGVPSGNYDGSSLAFEGNIVTAANFYQGLGSLQTVVIRVTNFVGKIIIRATLNNEYQSAVWFDADEFGDYVHPFTGVFTLNIRGNFVWMKPDIIDFSAGTIDSITITY